MGNTDVDVDGNPLVGIIMGSQSDWAVMKQTCDILDELGVANEARIISAHRTPERLTHYMKSAETRGLKCIIAGAGGAAHLAGVAAAHTLLPVLGVPMESKALKGHDSLLSIVQMPAGIPVGTLAIGTPGAKNAGLLAAAMLALSDEKIRSNLQNWRQNQADSIPLYPTD